MLVLVAEEVWTLIFLLIVAFIVLAVSSFILGYNVSDNAWWGVMYKTLDDCDKEIDSDRCSEDWAYGAIWAFHSIMKNVHTRTKNKKEN